jgi:hypothetical protein
MMPSRIRPDGQGGAQAATNPFPPPRSQAAVWQYCDGDDEPVQQALQPKTRSRPVPDTQQHEATETSPVLTTAFFFLHTREEPQATDSVDCLTPREFPNRGSSDLSGPLRLGLGY